MHKALHTRDDIDYMCQEKKEEEDSPALKNGSIHRYDNTETQKIKKIKTAKKDKL